MTPQKKARELVNKFKVRDGYFIPTWLSIQDAKIAIDEILEAVTEAEDSTISIEESAATYWKEVKKEIEKIE